MENKELNDKYYNIVKSDFRSCRPGLNELERVYKGNNLRDMLLLLRKFFVETVSLGRVKISEIFQEVPELMEDMNIYYNYDGVFKISESNELQEFCFFQDDPNAEFLVEVLGNSLCKINLVDCKAHIVTHSTSVTNCYSGGDSEVAIELNQSSSVLMVNVDNSNSVAVQNNGTGGYHYKEIRINT